MFVKLLYSALDFTVGSLLVELYLTHVLAILLAEEHKAEVHQPVEEVQGPRCRGETDTRNMFL